MSENNRGQNDVAVATCSAPPGPASWPAAAPCPAPSSAGAAVTTTCTLVPLNPNADTPAAGRHGLSGHGVSDDTTSSPSSGSGMCGLGAVKCSVAGICRWCTASTALISPAIPAAASRWPTLLFTEPISSGRPGGRAAPRTSPSARASIGSPSGVPVPCAST